MTPILKVSIWMDQPPQMSARKWGQFQKTSLHEMASKWHKEYLPRHFTRDAPQKYKHQARKDKYLNRKRRASKYGEKRGDTRVYPKYGGMIDNVYTGEMESRLRSIGVISSTPTRASLKMTGPRYMTMRVFQGSRKEAFRKGWTYGKGQRFNPAAGTQPDKVREITTQTPEELHELVVFLNERQLTRWRGWKEKRKVV